MLNVSERKKLVFKFCLDFQFANQISSNISCMYLSMSIQSLYYEYAVKVLPMFSLELI